MIYSKWIWGKKLKFNNLILSTDFKNNNFDKLIIYKNRFEKFEYLSSLNIDNSLKLLYENNRLKFKIFLNKSDEFILLKEVIRKNRELWKSKSTMKMN